MSATTIARLKEVWTDEHKRWSERDLSAKSYVYVWADSVYLQARLEDEAQCILVIIGATPEGKKELLGFVDGARESAHDWRALLLDLKRRGLSMAPKVAVADGALADLADEPDQPGAVLGGLHRLGARDVAGPPGLRGHRRQDLAPQP